MSEITRTEKFLRACIDGEPCALKPLTRVEKLLAELNDKLAGGPSEVVILPETELTLEGNGDAYITVQPSATPTEGGTADITCNGVKYTSQILRMESMFLMGNTEATGVAGGNSDAPFLVVINMEDSNGAYGMLRWLDEENWPDNDSVTISIVQVDAASGGESAASSIMIVNATSGVNPIEIESADKTYDEVYEAVMAGKMVFLWVRNETGVLYAMPAGTETGTDSNNNTASVLFFTLAQGFTVTWRYKEDGSWSATTD